jgi:hypothetical protein
MNAECVVVEYKGLFQEVTVSEILIVSSQGSLGIVFY